MFQNPNLHYLDNAATTIVAPEVCEAITQAMQTHWANPSSLYPAGAQSEEALAKARAVVARGLGCKPSEFYFTASGTEGSNMAIFGLLKNRTFGKKIVVSGFEHPAVQKPIENLAKDGYEVITVAPSKDGSLNINEMLSHVDKNTVLVSCMLVNNETGALCNVERLAKETKKINSRTIVHVDAVQAFMKVKFSLENIDSVAISGHKIHAPKGIGGLYIADKLWQNFAPPYVGGAQERGKRPGTENIPYAVGFAKAVSMMSSNFNVRTKHAEMLKNHLVKGLGIFENIDVNSPEKSSDYVFNFSENIIKSQTMLTYLAEENIFVSSASACGKGAQSHTLVAMGLPFERIDTALRVSFSEQNTIEDIDAFLNRLESGMKTLQKIKL